MNFAELVRLDYWFEGSSAGPATPITYAVIAFFALKLIGALVLWLLRRRLFPGQRIKTRLANRFGPWVVAVAAIGLVSAGLRVVEFPILSARVIWLASFLTLAGMGTYLAWYMVKRYPGEDARLRREEERQRFIPKPRRARRR